MPGAVSFALFALRTVAGVVMLAHGINHIFKGGKIAGTGRWFASLGMKPGVFHAWLASITELASGASLVFGFLTTLGGAGVTGVMVVAWIINHRKNGFFIFRPGEGYEYVMTLAVVGVVIATLGAGDWSIDHAVHLDRHLVGTPGLLIGLLAGAGGGLALLAGFWRPPKPTG